MNYLRVWLLLIIAALPGFAQDTQISATADQGLWRLQISCSNRGKTLKEIDFPPGMPFTPQSGQGPTLYLCQPVSLRVKAGAQAQANASAVAGPPWRTGAAGGAYLPGDPQQVSGAALLVHQEAGGGAARWKQLAAVLGPGAGGEAALRNSLNQLESKARAIEARTRGRRALNRKENPLAVTCFTQAIEAAPIASDYQLRAEAYSRQGQYGAALSDAEQALKLDPHDREALLRRAYARIYLKQLVEAQSDLDRVIAQDPCNSRAYRYRAYVRDQLKGPGAVEDYDASLRLNPFDPPTYYFRSMLLEARGQRAAAMSDAEKAVTLGGDNSGYLGWRGRLRGLSGDVPGALVDLKRALELNPNNGQAKDDLKRWGGGS